MRNALCAVSKSCMLRALIVQIKNQRIEHDAILPTMWSLVRRNCALLFFVWKRPGRGFLHHSRTLCSGFSASTEMSDVWFASHPEDFFDEQGGIDRWIWSLLHRPR